MAQKIHVTPNGPRECNDSSGLCPYVHFPLDQANQAQEYYEKKTAQEFEGNQTLSSQVFAKKKSSPRVRMSRLIALEDKVSPACRYGLLSHISTTAKAPL